MTDSDAEDLPGAKPPAQAMGVAGINGHEEAEQARAAERAAGVFEYRKLAAYPPFQMYMEEREPNEAGINSAQYALERMQAAIGDVGLQPFLDTYVTWWEGKGYWKGENPIGG